MRLVLEHKHKITRATAGVDTRTVLVSINASNTRCMAFLAALGSLGSRSRQTPFYLMLEQAKAEPLLRLSQMDARRLCDPPPSGLPTLLRVHVFEHHIFLRILGDNDHSLIPGQRSMPCLYHLGMMNLYRLIHLFHGDVWRYIPNGLSRPRLRPRLVLFRTERHPSAYVPHNGMDQRIYEDDAFVPPGELRDRVSTTSFDER